MKLMSVFLYHIMCVFSNCVIWLVISIGGCYFTSPVLHCPSWIHTSQKQLTSLTKMVFEHLPTIA